MSRKRVVVTGLGMLTPIGHDVESTWASILAGQSGVTMINHFNTNAFNTQFSASVKNFEPDRYIHTKGAKKTDLFIQYGMAAGIQAIADAELEINDTNADRIGVAIGSGIGGVPMIEKNHLALNTHGPRRVSPFFVPGSIINMISGNLSIMYGLRGPNIAITTACTSGTHNIGVSARMIAYGDADVMIAGGAEMATTPLGLAGFGAARALSTRNDAPQAASRPWDRDRDGFVLGDGAGVLVLEEYEVACRRGARIHAEVIGFGMSGDAHHITSPPEDGYGAVLSMRNAMRDARLNSDQIHYINAHATSTSAGDIAESNAVKQVLGAAAGQVRMSSTKSMIGHLLGAAGAVEAIFCVLAMRDQVAPPTINLDNPSLGCDLNYVANQAQQTPISVAMSNSFGFGGTNGTLIFGCV
jgi:3-oxoacyl-[acyl-carrier-protein] synthase II